MKESILEKLRARLLERRRQLVSDFETMSSHLSRTDDLSGDLSIMPIHMADIGSDNFEKEMSLDIIENEQEELREIDAALARMTDGSFGACAVCGKKISWPRLSALPYARLCIECQREEELEG